MAASTAGPYMHDLKPPTKAERERMEAEFRQRRNDEREFFEKTALSESQPITALQGQTIVSIERKVVRESDWDDGHLQVRLVGSGGTVVTLRGTSHDYDGEKPSIIAELS